MEKTMDKIVQVAKARGFVYPGSEIYGGGLCHPDEPTDLGCFRTSGRFF